MVRFGTSTDALDNAVQMIGDMQNVIMGYTLLSRYCQNVTYYYARAQYRMF